MENTVNPIATSSMVQESQSSPYVYTSSAETQSSQRYQSPSFTEETSRSNITEMEMGEMHPSVSEMQSSSYPVTTSSFQFSPASFNPESQQITSNQSVLNKLLESQPGQISPFQTEQLIQGKSLLMLTPKKSEASASHSAPTVAALLQSRPASYPASPMMLSPKMDQPSVNFGVHYPESSYPTGSANEPAFIHAEITRKSSMPITQKEYQYNSQSVKPSILAALLEAKSDPTPESSKLARLSSSPSPPQHAQGSLVLTAPNGGQKAGITTTITTKNTSQVHENVAANNANSKKQKQVSHEHIRRLLETHAPRSPPPVKPALPTTTTDITTTTTQSDDGESSFSKTVDVVIDHVAHGKSLDTGPSWVRRKPPMDPALKQVQAQILAERKQAELLRKSTHTVQRFPSQTPPQPLPPQRFNPNQAPQQHRQYQYQQQVQHPNHSQQQQIQQNPMQQTQFQQRAQSTPQGQPFLPQIPQSHSRNSGSMRQVQLIAAPRGLLPVPPGTVQPNTSDDHKFKKPLLPMKHRKNVQDDEKKKKENLEDVQRVQKHMMEARKASQEAAAAKAAKQSHHHPPAKSQPRSLPAPVPENIITDEMIHLSNAEKTRICLNGEIIEVHNTLIHSKYLLRAVLNKRTFHLLSPEAQGYLMKFLPPEAMVDLEAMLDRAFLNDLRSVQGNPIDLFHVKLKCGHFNAEKISDVCNLRDTQKILYDHYIRMYHMKLLKKLIVSRHILLSHYDNTHASNIANPGPAPVARDVLAERRLARSLKRRAERRTRMMLTDCRQKAGEQGISSDEEGDEPIEPINKCLQVTLHHRSTIYNVKTKDLDLWQPVKIDDVKTMLKKYKKLKKHHPKSPSLNLKGIKLEHVFERAGMLAQSKKIRETVEALEKNLQRPIDPASRMLFM